MNQQPLVSVIIPTYNRAEYVKKAVESVLNQTYKKIEIIVVDGSLNDETEKTLRPYLIDSRIKYIRQKEKHNGVEEDHRRGNPARARNKAIKLAMGKYIAPLDDDDFWCNQRKLEKQVQFLEQNPDYVACGGGYAAIQERNPEKLIFLNLPSEKDEEIREKIFETGMCSLSSLLFRKDDWKSVGGYNEGPIFSEEFEFVFKLGTVGKLYNFQEYFVYAWIWDSRKNKIWKKIGRKKMKCVIQLIKKYNHIYPNSHKAIFVAWLEYFYLFLPSNKFLRLLAVKIKKILLTEKF